MKLTGPFLCDIFLLKNLALKDLMKLLCNICKVLKPYIKIIARLRFSFIWHYVCRWYYYRFPRFHAPQTFLREFARATEERSCPGNIRRRCFGVDDGECLCLKAGAAALLFFMSAGRRRSQLLDVHSTHGEMPVLELTNIQRKAELDRCRNLSTCLWPHKKRGLAL